MWKSCTAGRGCGILATMPWWFSFLTLGAWILVVALALLSRGRQFATFAGVIGGLHSLIAPAEIAPMFVPVMPVFVALHIAVLYEFFDADQGPDATPVVSAAGELAGLLFLGWNAAGAAVGGGASAGIFAVGNRHSLRTGGDWDGAVVCHARGRDRSGRAAIITSITRSRCRIHMAKRGKIGRCALCRSVTRTWGRLCRCHGCGGLLVGSEEKDLPDLICLTGDFLTMESHHDPELLRRSLEPLAALKGRVFACHGNHNHEAPETVR